MISAPFRRSGSEIRLSVRSSLQSTCLLLLGWLVAASIGAPAASAAESSHKDEITAWAPVMANFTTAQDRCPGLSLDETQLVAEKDRLHIADADYFAFRPLARARADALAMELSEPGKLDRWCRDTAVRFGGPP